MAAVPEAILKAISWVEKVAEFFEEQRATHGRLAGQLRTRSPRYFFGGCPSYQEGPPLLCVPTGSAREGGSGPATGCRIWAWAKLVKVWASLRWSDLEAIIPPVDRKQQYVAQVSRNAQSLH